MDEPASQFSYLLLQCCFVVFQFPDFLCALRCKIASQLLVEKLDLAKALGVELWEVVA